MRFNLAQNIPLNSSLVANSQTAAISSIGLYFMYRPDPVANKTATVEPGVTIYLTDVTNDLPNLANTSMATARLEWNQINASSDASVETRFKFPVPVIVSTNKTYSILIAYDNNEDFVLWQNITGNPLVGSNTASSGPSLAGFAGSLYEYSPSVGSNTGVNASSTWTPIINTTLKFSLYAARYAINGDPVVANNTLLSNVFSSVVNSNLWWNYDNVANNLVVLQPFPCMEVISFDPKNSSAQVYIGPQTVYQKSVYWPGGSGGYATVATVVNSNIITANSATSGGTSFDWNNVFSNTYTGSQMIVVDYGSNVVDVLPVIKIINSSAIQVGSLPTVANDHAKFMISPAATIDSINPSFLNGKNQVVMALRNSTANSTVRFTTDSVDFANTVIYNGGSGYKNTDVMYVIGYEEVAGVVKGNYVAVANITVNVSNSNTISTISFSNIGAGFSNASNLSVVFCTGANLAPNNGLIGNSSGTSANIGITISSILKTDQTYNMFSNCAVLNIDMNDMLFVPLTANAMQTSVGSGLSSLTAKFQYYSTVNNSLTSGLECHLTATPIEIPIQSNTRTSLVSANLVPTIVSRSNEFNIMYSNGASNDKVSALLNYSNCCLLQYNTKILNDWSTYGFYPNPTVEFSKYIINNDYSTEYNDGGSALARHITTAISLQGANGTIRQAEDIRVYLTAYRPTNTDIQVFARIFNDADPNAFDDEDWTRLQLIDGDIHRSDTYIDMTFGFQNQPNSASVVAGSATTSNNSANITGVGTSWSTDLAANTLIKVYDPLFPNTNFAVVMVKSVANNTQITVDQIFSSNTTYGIGGPEISDVSGLKIDKINYPHQAFINIQNDNTVRYYNDQFHVFDNYDTFAIKVVLLSADSRVYPRLHNIRGIAVSS